MCHTAMNANYRRLFMTYPHFNWHYKIFCVNVKYGIQYEFRIFLFNRFAK